MKQTHAVNIIGTPAVLGGSTAPSCNCPQCGRALQIREDGSGFCLNDGKFFEPEMEDLELFQMRREFDIKRGISASVRVLNMPRFLGLPQLAQHLWQR